MKESHILCITVSKHLSGLYFALQATMLVALICRMAMCVRLAPTRA